MNESNSAAIGPVEMRDALDGPQLFRRSGDHRERAQLEICLRWRHTILPTFPFLRDRLKEQQVSMVKLRHWHRTGIYPGEA